MDVATVAWVAPSGSEAGSLAPQDHRALEEWGRARGVRLLVPGTGTTPTLPVDLSIGDRVEDELETARDAVSGLDADLAERYLARAEALLRAHPELPEGAWLMAEVEREWSIRWTRVPPRDLERAASAWRRARALDGGRQAGLGEEATATTAPEIPFVLTLNGSGEARIDGQEVAPGPLRALAGEHQLTVAREKHLVWAGWVGVTDGATLRVALPAPSPCSTEDLSRVRVDARGVQADGVRCERWIVAQPGMRDGVVYVATCRVDRCGTLLEWSVGEREPRVADARPYPGFHWPKWATCTLVGVGAAAIAGTTLALTGVFPDKGTNDAFSFGGVHEMSLRIPGSGEGSNSAGHARARPR